MNGNYEHQETAKDLSPTQSPISRFDSPNKKVENADAKGSLLHCDICEKKEFVSEVELIAHKRLQHNKLSSPGRVRLLRYLHSLASTCHLFLLNFENSFRYLSNRARVAKIMPRNTKATRRRHHRPLCGTKVRRSCKVPHSTANMPIRPTTTRPHAKFARNVILPTKPNCRLTRSSFIIHRA